MLPLDQSYTNGPALWQSPVTDDLRITPAPVTDGLFPARLMDQNRTMAALYPRNLGDLRELASTPFARETCSPLGAHRSVVLRGALLDDLQGALDRDMLAAWLTALPCPVIGIDGREPTVYTPCDVVASSDGELSAIVANIDRCPLAASVLVQVLRTTSSLPVPQALTLESLAYATLQGGPEHKAWLVVRGPAAEQPRLDVGPPVLMDGRDDRLDLRLNRPARLNALSLELRDALCEAFQLVIADPAIRTVRVAGEGRCFSIGGDLAEFGSAPDPATAHAVRSIRLPAFFLSQCADRVAFALHGACIGAGVELPAFGHRVTAARNAFFQLPEIRFGLIPGAGGCVSIPRRIGRQRTAWLALTSRRITAAKALEWGLVDALVD